MLRSASDADFEFLNALAPVDHDSLLRAQIRDGRLFVIEHSGERVGFIKSCVLWEKLPFIEVVVIREESRKRGIGRAAVRAWEQVMAERSHPRVLVSTDANGMAQHFWRRIGYRDCGTLELPGQPAELFLFRAMSDSDS